MLRYKNISKEISHGALDMLYSEGNFRFSIEFSVHGILVLPSQLTNRVKNVEFVFHGHSEWHSQKFSRKSFPTHQDHIITICHSTIADFTGAKVTRNGLCMWLYLCGPAIIETLSVRIFERLKALFGSAKSF